MYKYHYILNLHSESISMHKMHTIPCKNVHTKSGRNISVHSSSLTSNRIWPITSYTSIIGMTIYYSSLQSVHQKPSILPYILLSRDLNMSINCSWYGTITANLSFDKSLQLPVMTSAVDKELFLWWTSCLGLLFDFSWICFGYRFKAQESLFTMHVLGVWHGWLWGWCHSPEFEGLAVTLLRDGCWVWSLCRSLLLCNASCRFASILSFCSSVSTELI